jgi:anthranilate synthase component 1
MAMDTDQAFEIFEKNFQDGKSQILHFWNLSDTETPTSSYLKLCENLPYAFLLESVEGGAVLGRYTVLGFDPDLIWTCDGADASLHYLKTDRKIRDPLPPIASLRQILNNSQIDFVPEGLPPMAASGLFGYFTYDMIRQVEQIPDTNPDHTHVPDAIFIRPRVLVIFDNVMHKICLAAPVYEHTGTTDRSARDVYEETLTLLTSAASKMETIPPRPLPRTDLSSLTSSVSSNMSPDDFHDMVDKAKEHIRAGDIFQVVLSQRFSAPFELPPFEFYRSLRRTNPSPFLFYLQYPGFSLAGSSPEILVRVRDEKVTIRPIAGTRKRGETATEDLALEKELLADPKERAEHLMLLDLGRNDVGRVAEIGSVRVTEQFVVERYSHVMHIVSNVEGNLRADLDGIDALLAGFPAGTVSGAPKIRAMEIIDDLEPEKRKFYGGCIGYLAGNRTVDTCIALRTALIKDGKIFIQAGAGIVADSIPEMEFQETVNKAKALVRSVDDAYDRAIAAQKNFSLSRYSQSNNY